MRVIDLINIKAKGELGLGPLVTLGSWRFHCIHYRRKSLSSRRIRAPKTAEWDGIILPLTKERLP